jgi:hypothetical protein
MFCHHNTVPSYLHEKLCVISPINIHITLELGKRFPNKFAAIKIISLILEAHLTDIKCFQRRRWLRFPCILSDCWFPAQLERTGLNYTKKFFSLMRRGFHLIKIIDPSSSTKLSTLKDGKRSFLNHIELWPNWSPDLTPLDLFLSFRLKCVLDIISNIFSDHLFLGVG